MNRAIIVHCWGGVPDSRWYPSAKRDLENIGFTVSGPAMPDTDEPNLSKWLPKLQEVAGEPDENLFLIGHSVGCITILRYLETLNDTQKIGGVILVAGFTDMLRGSGDIEDELKSFFREPIDFEKIKSKAGKFVAIHSDDDPYVDLKYGREFEEKLGAELIVQHAMGHFTESTEDEVDVVPVTKLPIVVEKIKEMINN